MTPKPESQKYTVVQPGKAVHQFESGEDAVRHLLDHPGFAQLFGPDGILLMTKGRHDQDGA